MMKARILFVLVLLFSTCLSADTYDDAITDADLQNLRRSLEGHRKSAARETTTFDAVSTVATAAMSRKHTPKPPQTYPAPVAIGLLIAKIVTIFVPTAACILKFVVQAFIAYQLYRNDLLKLKAALDPL